MKGRSFNKSIVMLTLLAASFFVPHAFALKIGTPNPTLPHTNSSPNKETPKKQAPIAPAGCMACHRSQTSS